MTASSDGASVLITAETGAAIPGVDNYSEELVFAYWVDAGGDAVPEYIASIESSGDGSYFGVLFDMDSAIALSGPEFPGVVLVDGSTAFMRLELASIGSPATVGFQMQVDWLSAPDPTNDPFNYTEAHDYVPQSTWPDDSTYLRIAGT